MVGGTVQTCPLMIRRKVTQSDLASFRRLVAPYWVIRIRARVMEGSAFGGPEALLDDFVGRDDSDQELNDYAKQLQKPVTLADSVLGTFTLDRRVNWFTGCMVWNSKPVTVQLCAETPAKVQAALKTAHSLWEAQAIWDQRVRDYAAQALLQLKNESWLGEDEAEVSADQFKQRMMLESVTVHPEGDFEFWHRDGGLFWGHFIQVTGCLSEGPTGADIPG
jgi:hypothetical protein